MWKMKKKAGVFCSQMMMMMKGTFGGSLEGKRQGHFFLFFSFNVATVSTMISFLPFFLLVCLFLGSANLHMYVLVPSVEIPSSFWTEEVTFSNPFCPLL